MILPAILCTFKGKLLLGLSTVFTTVAISEALLGDLISAIPPTLAVLVTLYVLKTGQNRNAQALDGKLTMLMEAKVAAAEAKGKLEEREAEIARQGAAALAQQSAAPPVHPASPVPVIVENTKDNPANVKHTEGEHAN